MERNNKGQFVKGYIHTNEFKEMIRKSSENWHKENKNTEKYKQRGDSISKAKLGVPRIDMINNKFAVGNKPNQTAFKKGLIPWNMGKKCPQISKGLKGRITPIETRIKQSKIRKEHLKEGTIKVLRGQEHPHWLGGKSFEPYNSKFNTEFKGLIRLRDNYCCLNCGVSEQKSIIIRNKKLVVHHIDYDKLNTCLQNCCTLCTTCNNQANFNRTDWQKHFQNLLTSRYNYQYELNEVIIG